MGVVMLFKIAAVAGLAILTSYSPVVAQSLSGPAERPPSNFRGAQYVDSRGCVFLRAGVGGQVNWVARISRNRKALCGFPPTFGNNQVAIADEAPAAPAPQAAPAPRVVATEVGTSRRPIDTIASLTTPPRIVAARPVAPARRAPAYVPAAPVAAAPVAPPRPAATAVAPQRQANGCPADAPYGEKVRYVDGRQGLICSPDQSSLTAHIARRNDLVRTAPVAVAAAPARTDPPANDGYRPQAARGGIVCPASAPVARRYAYQSGGSTVMCTNAEGDFASATPPLGYGNSAEVSAPVVPKGYKKAWKDDRLNPRRGYGTAAGQARQDQVWTREVPARQVVAAAPAKRSYVASSSNQPRAAAAPRSAAGYYVQVGTFGVASNAQGAGARLSQLGLPVAASRITRKGKALQIVMAGPFGDAGQAQAALSAARRAGFGDAFIR